jgi:hypothetical protein
MDAIERTLEHLESEPVALPQRLAEASATYLLVLTPHDFNPTQRPPWRWVWRVLDGPRTDQSVGAHGRRATLSSEDARWCVTQLSAIQQQLLATRQELDAQAPVHLRSLRWRE